MSAPDLQGLMMDNMVQAQSFSLLAEIQTALLNKEGEVNDTLREVLGDPENLYQLVWVLDDKKPNFVPNWQKLNNLAKNILASSFEGIPKGLIPDMKEARLKYKQLAIDVYAIYKMENKQVLMNISRKMLEAERQKAKTSGNTQGGGSM